MSWVRPDQEILPDLPQTPANAQFYNAVMVVVSRKLGRKYHTNRVLNPGPVMCESITLSARPQLLPGFGHTHVIRIMYPTYMDKTTALAGQSYDYRIRPNRRPGPLRKYVLYH